MSPKFKTGDKVYYTPKISGFNNKKPLTVEFVNYQKDDLATLFGVNSNKSFYYSFKNSNLNAIETDLIKNR